MRIRIALGLVFVLCLLPILHTEAQELCDSVCNTMGTISRESPYVVQIFALGTGQQTTGTATLISFQNLRAFLTNYHVVANALRIWISYGSIFLEVTPLGKDPLIDVALLSVPVELPLDMPTTKFAESLIHGQQVYALGYPAGEQSITMGRINGMETKSWRFALTQAPLNPGNSGGPVFNENHEMVGLSTANETGTFAMGLIVPTQYIEKVLPRLFEEKLVKHGSPGFSFGDTSKQLPPFFEQQGLNYPPRRHGIMVVGLNPESPAAQADIKVGDIILSIDDVPVPDARSLEKNLFFEHRPGDTVQFGIERNSETLSRTIRLQ